MRRHALFAALLAATAAAASGMTVKNLTDLEGTWVGYRTSMAYVVTDADTNVTLAASCTWADGDLLPEALFAGGPMGNETYAISYAANLTIPKSGKWLGFNWSAPAVEDEDMEALVAALDAYPSGLNATVGKWNSTTGQLNYTASGNASGCLTWNLTTDSKAKTVTLTQTEEYSALISGGSIEWLPSSCAPAANTSMCNATLVDDDDKSSSSSSGSSSSGSGSKDGSGGLPEDYVEAFEYCVKTDPAKMQLHQLTTCYGLTAQGVQTALLVSMMTGNAGGDLAEGFAGLESCYSGLNWLTGGFNLDAYEEGLRACLKQLQDLWASSARKEQSSAVKDYCKAAGKTDCSACLQCSPWTGSTSECSSLCKDVDAWWADFEEEEEYDEEDAQADREFLDSFFGALFGPSTNGGGSSDDDDDGDSSGMDGFASLFQGILDGIINSEGNRRRMLRATRAATRGRALRESSSSSSSSSKSEPALEVTMRIVTQLACESGKCRDLLKR